MRRRALMVVVAKNNIITYTASSKLAETTSTFIEGLHTNAFSGTNGTLTMVSHTFEKGVGTIEFNDDVTIIGERAFYACTGLTSVTIGSGVRGIGNGAFGICSSLTSIEIPSGVTIIGGAAFKGCANLTSITCYATTAPTIESSTFQDVKTGGTLYVPSGSSGYDVWMTRRSFYLGYSNWTKVEQ